VSTLEADRFSRQTLPCCVCGFSGGQMDILMWDSKSHGGKMPEVKAPEYRNAARLVASEP
jgi:hypothetical protein